MECVWNVWNCQHLMVLMVYTSRGGGDGGKKCGWEYRWLCVCVYKTCTAHPSQSFNPKPCKVLDPQRHPPSFSLLWLQQHKDQSTRGRGRQE